MNLQSPYNKEEFVGFLKEFLPGFINDSRKVNVLGLKVTESMVYLGQSSELDLQVFELTHLSSTDARVSLAMDGFKTMKNSGVFKALIVYRSDKSKDWRLSLMTANPVINQKGKIGQSFSNPRRFSFFLGPNAKINTPTKYLINKGKISDFEDLKNRFSLEVVNKDFYQEISRLFTKLVGGTLGSSKKRQEYKSLLELPFVANKSQISSEFAVRLMGRVIFCWFLREKRSDSNKPLMPYELLSFQASKEKEDYYHKILEPIFFEILNKPIKSRKETYSNELFNSIPYLNGGLFSPHDDDYFSYNENKQASYHNMVKVPDGWIKEFFEFLETYNFTIDENIAFDEELSIDPEMLGRIFENLLAEINPETGESARKSTGSYYTPRIIVDYMVDESLFAYLKEKTKIDDEKLRAIISYDLTDDSQFSLSNKEKEGVIDALSAVKILDPACGSGAFPIGAMQKIVFILQQTDPDGQKWFSNQIKNTSIELKRVIEREFANKNFDYIRKLGIIRENIFGVDIQPIATEISRLRCFLTLVVDEEIEDGLENRGIEPLPNLDFKFVTANSLIPLPNDKQDNLFQDKEDIDELKSLRNQFFSSTNLERYELKDQFKEIQKKMLDRMIKMRGGDELTHKLSMWDPFSHTVSPWFDPEWMFGVKDGFNIVIANPPYVRADEIAGSVKDVYKKLFLTASGKYDLYFLFFEKAFQILSSAGVCVFITPNKFCAADSAANLRNLMLQKMHLKEILSTSRLRVFGGVSNYPVISILTTNLDDNKVCIRQAIDINKLNQTNGKNGYITAPDELKKLPASVIPINTGQDSYELIQKLYKSGLNFSRLLSISEGLRIPTRYESEKPSDFEIVKQYQFERYTKIRIGSYISKRNIGAIVSEKSDRYTKILTEKILIAEDSTQISATLDNRHMVPQGGVYFGVRTSSAPDLNFILGVLNSKPLSVFYEILYAGMHMGSGYLRYRSKFLESLPISSHIYKPSDQTRKKVSSLVEKILTITSGYGYDFNNPPKEQILAEKQIDQLVYKLYGLNSEEIGIIENSGK